MTKEELQKSVDNNMKFVREFYDKGENNFNPMFIIESIKDGKTKDMIAIAPDERALENKYDRLFDMGILASLQRYRGDVDSVSAIFMICEAWVSVQNKDDEKNVKVMDFVQPSQDPKRREAIISTALAHDGINAFTMYEVKRSIDLNDETIKINLVPFEKDVSPENAIETESPLLKSFWSGVDLMDKFVETLPVELERYVKELPMEEMFYKIMRQLEEFRRKK